MVSISKTMAPDYRLLFEASPYPYIILRVDPSYTIVAVNDRYLKATGTQRHEIVGRRLFDVFPDNPFEKKVPSVKDLRTSLERVVRHGIQDIMGVQKYDIPVPGSPDGFKEKYWSPVNTPVFGEDGRVAFIIHHVEDVTEFILERGIRPPAGTESGPVKAALDRMEAEVIRRAGEMKDANRKLKEMTAELERREDGLTRLNERLSELDQAKTKFFANVSHEFRTPLTLVIGPIEEILAKSEGQALEIRDALILAHRNALRLLKLVNALLDYSRIESGRAQAAFTPTDLSAFTTNLASHFRSVCENAGLELVVHCPPLSAPVYVDRQLWEKVLLNLLSNAFKYTFEGTIEVRLREQGGTAVLTVRDTGTGIPKADLPHIFDRFHRVAGARGRSYEGTGIGLALVAEIVKLHHGTIDVQSAPGRGSTFSVRLPFGSDHLPKQQLATTEAEYDPAATAANARTYVDEAFQWLPEPHPAGISAESAAPPKARIIVADDNADMRAYIAHLLEAEGYRVEAVADGKAALAACQKEVPDLMLSDLMMPEMDGLALLAHLRANDRTAVAPVILISGSSGEEARVKGFAAGADDYMVKPFAARELIARVDGAIRLARIRQEAARREREMIAQANEALTNEVEERKRAQDQLVQLMAELQDKNKALDEFAYAVSHDLRAPLRAMNNFSQALLEDYGDSLQGEAGIYLDQIKLATRNMNLLIEGLLALSRNTRGVINKDRVDLSAIAAKIRFELSQAEPARRGDWQIEPDLTAWGDARMLEAVMNNLLGNAWKYTGGTQYPVIRFHSRQEDGKSHFCVTDNGAGFDMGHAGLLFKPFQRLHRQDEFPGIGIGLTTIKRIIDRHGGTIRADASVGMGATFCFWLPGPERED